MRRILTLMLVGCSIGVFAQQDTVRTGEVVDAQVVIEKEKEIRLPIAQKLNTPLPSYAFESEPLRLEYNTTKPDLNWPSYNPRISPQPISISAQEVKYQNYLRAGYGNFSSPLIQLGVFNKINETLKLQVSAGYESFARGPIGDENSATSSGQVNLSASYKTGNLELIPQLSYRRSDFYFYGNTDRFFSGFSSETPSDGDFNDFNLNLSLKGKLNNEATYYVKPAFISAIQNDNVEGSENKESGLSFESGLVLPIDSTVQAGIKLTGYVTEYRGGLVYNRSLLNINPWVSKRFSSFSLKGGFTVSTEQSGGNGSQAGFYPALEGSWDFSKDWTAYGNLKGGFESMQLAQLLNENSFMNDSLVILNPELTSSFEGGLKGELLENLSFQAGLRLDNYEDLPFMIPSSSDSSKFTLTYDGRQVNITTLLIRSTYQVDRSLKLGATIDFYDYAVKDLEEAWHRPDYRFSAFAEYNFNERLYLRGDLIALGGIKVPVRTLPSGVSLESFIDLSLQTNYIITERASVFLDVTNLFGTEYERYLGYPVRGISFKLGGKYRF